MSTVYTTGAWRPFPGQEEAFQERWTEFVEWATSQAGAGRAVLARDIRDEGRFVSFLGWDSMEAMRDWKDSPEFKPRMGQVQQHIDKFDPTELELLVECEGGRAL